MRFAVPSKARTVIAADQTVALIRRGQPYFLEFMIAAISCWFAIVVAAPMPDTSLKYFDCMFSLLPPSAWGFWCVGGAVALMVAPAIEVVIGAWGRFARVFALVHQGMLFTGLGVLALCNITFTNSFRFGTALIITLFAIAQAIALGVHLGEDLRTRELSNPQHGKIPEDVQ